MMNSKGRKPRPKVVKKANETIQKGKQQQQGPKQKQGPQQKQQGPKGKGPKVPKMFGGVGGYQGVNRKDVSKLVGGQIRDAVRPLANDRKFIRNQANDAIEDTNTLYDRSVGDLNYVFGEAGDYINHMGQQINTGYQNTGTQMANIAQGAVSGIQQNNSAAQQAVMSELQRLGMGQNMGVDSNLIGDGAHSANMATQMGANAQTNNAAAQQSANTVSGLLGGMIAGSKASNLGIAANTRDADISDINRTKRDDLSTVLDNIQELKKSRPTAIREMLLQLQAQGFDQWQAIQALNMDRRSLNHSMSMDRAGMQEDSAYYGTLSNAYGAQAGSNPYSAPSLNGPSKPGTSNPGAGYTNGTPPVRKGPKKSKPRAGSGSRNDEIPGPLAGGWS